MLITLQKGERGAQNLWVLYNQTETKTTLQNTSEKLSMEIRQTSSYKTSKGKCSRFSSSLGGHVRFVSPSPLCCLSFLALIAVYKERVITCETGRVIFLPRVWILSRPIAISIAPSLRWLNPNGWMERRSTESGERERGWQRGLTWALNHAPRNPPSTGSWQPRCHHGQATSYASWQHWSRISQSIRCKLELFKDDNEHQDTCRCHWRDAIMIGCPSHHALLSLMVFRPGMGRRRAQGEAGMDREKVFCCDQLALFVLIGFCRTLWPEMRTSTQGLHAAVYSLTCCLLCLSKTNSFFVICQT